MKNPRFQTTESTRGDTFAQAIKIDESKSLRNERDLNTESEKAKSAEAILADPLIVRGVVDIDEHVLVGMSGQKARKDFNKLFLLVGLRAQEPVTDVEPVGALAAIQPNPIT